MAAVQAGDADAKRRLYEEYGPHLLRAVRRRLAPRMRSAFDSMDFAQDVWASFFAASADKYDLTNPGQLISLLRAMARNKILEAVRQRVKGENRKPVRENSLEGLLDGGVHLPGPEQTPSQFALDEEAWHTVFASQPPVYRCILLMLRDGKSHETIAKELNVSLRTVQRVLNKLNE